MLLFLFEQNERYHLAFKKFSLQSKLIPSDLNANLEGFSFQIETKFVAINRGALLLLQSRFRSWWESVVTLKKKSVNDWTYSIVCNECVVACLHHWSTKVIHLISHHATLIDYFFFNLPKLNPNNKCIIKIPADQNLKSRMIK